jgi:hypothetical protein
MLEGLALDHDSADGTHRPHEPTHASLPLASVDIISEQCSRRDHEKVRCEKLECGIVGAQTSLTLSQVRISSILSAASRIKDGTTWL